MGILCCSVCLNKFILTKYFTQFNLRSTPYIIEMELDMTQTHSRHGILKFIMHNAMKEDVEDGLDFGRLDSGLGFDDEEIVFGAFLIICLIIIIL